MCGLWLPIWILASLGNSGEEYRCVQCGSGPKRASWKVIGLSGSAVAIVGIIILVSLLIFASRGNHEIAQSEADKAAGRGDQVEDFKAVQAANLKAQTAQAVLKFQMEQSAQGSAYAQYKMGMRYLTGDGVALDAPKARELLAKSAAQGNPEATAQPSNMDPSQ